MLIVGAGGLAIQMIELIEQYVEQPDALCFFDDTSDVEEFFLSTYKILHSESDVLHHFTRYGPQFVIAVSSPAHRRSLTEKFERLGGTPVSLISDRTSIGKYEQYIGAGTVILGGGIIESTTSIGHAALLNVQVVVTHDCKVGDYCEIGPGVILCGHVTIGNSCFIGAGAIILPHISVGDGSIIGAGAVVNKDVKPGEKIIGVPGRVQ